MLLNDVCLGIFDPPTRKIVLGKHLPLRVRVPEHEVVIRPRRGAVLLVQPRLGPLPRLDEQRRPHSCADHMPRLEDHVFIRNLVVRGGQHECSKYRWDTQPIQVVGEEQEVVGQPLAVVLHDRLPRLAPDRHENEEQPEQAPGQPALQDRFALLCQMQWEHGVQHAKLQSRVQCRHSVSNSKRDGHGGLCTRRCQLPEIPRRLIRPHEETALVNDNRVVELACPEPMNQLAILTDKPDQPRQLIGVSYGHDLIQPRFERSFPKQKCLF
mmetsp:Transcript_13941/g.33745  ORF Transcript_13941/g.33745 Transcript_13941/m.33745 type:complete len:268 (-) Transcript_13941:561-1364(-)